jgi:hypothetical protein
MILSSHYVIKDVMHTVQRGDAEEIRKACEKYSGRYRHDDAFCGICNALMDEELSEKEQQETLTKLQDLLSVRKTDSSGGTGLWFTDRRKINR